MSAIAFLDLTCDLDRNGFHLHRRVFTSDEVLAIRRDLEQALLSQSESAGSIRDRASVVMAARNIVSIWPGVTELVRSGSLGDILIDVLGPDCGLVRGLFFDKPPGQSWALPWHKDMTIAVRDHRLPSEHFARPTTKAGVPHVEASEFLLASMLTARIHLDDVTDDNGPLRVIPGSHRHGKQATTQEDAVIQTIHATAGDVLFMRPLLTHSSPGAREGTTLHRRILHLEFARTPVLPDGYHWYTFVPVGR